MITIVASFFTVLVGELNFSRFLDAIILTPCYQPRVLHPLVTVHHL